MPLRGIEVTQGPFLGLRGCRWRVPGWTVARLLTRELGKREEWREFELLRVGESDEEE
jgi:hypothetical protein